jgi:hypothetical protein
MRSMLVAPGVPSGTPATTITRWPGLAKKARRFFEAVFDLFYLLIVVF